MFRYELKRIDEFQKVIVPIHTFVFMRKYKLLPALISKVNLSRLNIV